MKYTAELMPKAIKDPRDIPATERKRIIERIETMTENLAGDVRKLTNHTPEYRMRYGNWRVLCEIEGDRII